MRSARELRNQLRRREAGRFSGRLSSRPFCRRREGASSPAQAAANLARKMPKARRRTSLAAARFALLNVKRPTPRPRMSAPDPAQAEPLFKRVVVKLSGEALMGRNPHGLDMPTLARIARDLKEARDLGVQVAVVVGGGNFFRGIAGADKGIERARADSIGMLATVMNALAMEGALEEIGQPARVLSAVAMPSVCQPYSRQAALAHLVKRRVILLAGGTGNPFFTTDTGAALRAAELSANAVMKATQVDGIYSEDPKKNPHAERYERLTHDEAIESSLAVMDTAAFALARENRIPIVVFSVHEPGAISAALAGQGRATYVMPEA